MRKLAMVLPFFVGVVGCGASLGEPEAPTSQQMSASMSLGTTSTDFVAIKGGDKDKALGLQAMMASIGPSGTKVKASGGLGFPLGGGEPLMPMVDPVCVTGDAATGWTYNMCKNENGSIDGTVKIAGDTITIDLTITASGSGTTAKVDLKGSVTVTATSINGSLEYNIGAAALGVGGLNTKVTWTNVTFAAGCLTGGSVLIDYSTTGISGVAEYVYTGCNAFQVRNGK